MEEQPSIESFLTSSADHQDATFRLVQYACRLIGSLNVGAKRRWYYAVCNNLDASRILTRTFGIVYALRAAANATHERLHERLADLALCLYHPCETAYWVLLVTNSPHAERRRTFSRLSSLFGAAWGILYGASVYRRLRALTDAASDTGGVDDGTANLIADEIIKLRRQLMKLALDALLSLHWALDHRTVKLSDWQVGLVGTASAVLGLRLQWSAHASALQAADDDEYEYDDDEEEDGEEEEQSEAQAETPDGRAYSKYTPDPRTGTPTIAFHRRAKSAAQDAS